MTILWVGPIFLATCHFHMCVAIVKVLTIGFTYCCCWGKNAQTNAVHPQPTSPPYWSPGMDIYVNLVLYMQAGCNREPLASMAVVNASSLCAKDREIRIFHLSSLKWLKKKPAHL